MFTRIVAAFFLLFPLSFSATASADIVFDNTMNGIHPTNLLGGAGYRKMPSEIASRVAVKFDVSGATYRLDGVGISVFRTGADESALLVTLAADDAGQPGTVLDTLSENATDWITTRTLVNLASVSKPTLEDGKSYWVILEPNKASGDYSYEWAHANTATQLSHIQQSMINNGVAFGAWMAPNGTAPVGLKIQGTELSALGVLCSEDDECISGHCADGVCCDTACGDSNDDDCMACSTAAGSDDSDGTCSPLSTTKAPMVECRAAQGACDEPEICSNSSMECPASKVDACEPDGGADDAGLPDLGNDIQKRKKKSSGCAVSSTATTGNSTALPLMGLLMIASAAFVRRKRR